MLASFAQSPEAPDVILLDYKMEGLNGIDTVKALRATQSLVPAFIFTAYAGGLDLRLVKQLGNCEVLLKTVDLTNLRHVVNGAMALKQLRQTDCVECQSAEC
jgi:CheY-like chemotaxis protein